MSVYAVAGQADGDAAGALRGATAHTLIRTVVSGSAASHCGSSHTTHCAHTTHCDPSHTVVFVRLSATQVATAAKRVKKPKPGWRLQERDRRNLLVAIESSKQTTYVDVHKIVHVESCERMLYRFRAIR